MKIDDILYALEMAPARIRVVLSNLLTYLLAAQTVVVWLIANGTFDDLPQVVEWLTVAGTVIGAAVVVIRRVTPVEKPERGLLPR